MPALTSGRYHIGWTRLANLPAPMYDPYVTIQDKKIYVTGGTSPEDNAFDQVYIYDINADQWDRIPPSGQCGGIPQIIGGKLAVIGGHLTESRLDTNKVSTFDEASEAWISYYPDLLSARSRPGVVTHLEYVIVAGGVKSDSKPIVQDNSDSKSIVQDESKPIVQDDIEVLNWIENCNWRKVSINLPVPMYAFTPTICDDYLLVVGYTGADVKRYKNSFKILISDIIKLVEPCQPEAKDPRTKWIPMADTTYLHAAPVRNFPTPTVVGGEDQNGTTTGEIEIYDSGTNSWRNLTALSSARSSVAAVAVSSNNALVVIGGYTEGDSIDNALDSSLDTVEWGKAEYV